MSRQQMLCFISPSAPSRISASVKRRIDRMCRTVGRIHFSTLALLPAAPGASPLAEPSLMFEVVIDEDLQPVDLVALMIRFGFDALWELYKKNWTGPVGADSATKRDWLRALLMKHLNVATCGFVGVRDRNVSQVLAEERLFKQTRQAFDAMPPGQRPKSVDALADLMRVWVRRPGFDWVDDPAPRSRWRKGPDFGVLQWLALSVRLVLPFVALVSALMAIGYVVFQLATLLNAIYPPTPRDASVAVLLAALALLLALIVPLGTTTFGGLGILGLAVLLACSLLVTAYAAGWATYSVIDRLDLSPLTTVVQMISLGLASVLVFGAAAAFVALVPILLSLRAPPFFGFVAVLGFMAFAYLLVYILGQSMFALLNALGGSSFASADPWTRLVGHLFAAVAVALVTAAGIIFFTKLPPILMKVSKRLDRPGRLAKYPAHQVHSSIETCEAKLAQRTSHMISLTEIKRPYFYHRFWLCFWLRVVDVLGVYFFTEGVLGNARGIKFGHWHIVGNGRRLLFCSNFDGAFGGYLDEFIRGATEGANLIWRQSELQQRNAARWNHPTVPGYRPFPPTFLGIFKGCKAEQAFKAYARASMIPFVHRFEAYRLSNDDIERATRLREALRGTRSAAKDDLIARALES